MKYFFIIEMLPASVRFIGTKFVSVFLNILSHCMILWLASVEQQSIYIARRFIKKKKKIKTQGDYPFSTAQKVPKR